MHGGLNKIRKVSQIFAHSNMCQLLTSITVDLNQTSSTFSFQFKTFQVDL